MYFDSISREYLDAIAKLEEKVYPPGMAEGLESLEKRYCNSELRDSICGFEKGELKCYILASKIHDKEHMRKIYIDDLNCLNPKYLHRLLIIFFKLTNPGKEYNVLYCAELREKSYHLLMNRMKRNPQIIELCDDEYLPGYYPNGEDAHRVSFRVHLDNYIRQDWKIYFQMQIDCTDTIFCNIHYTIRECVGDKAFKDIDPMQEDVQEYMIKCLAEKIIGYYQMFGEHIPTVAGRELCFRDNRAFEKAIHTLEEYGYKNDNSSLKSYQCSSTRGIIELTTRYETYNTQYPDTLSGYRWLFRKTCKDIAKMHFIYLYHYDKYGKDRYIGSVPYLNRTSFRNIVDEALYINKKVSSMQIMDNEERSEYHLFGSMVRRIWRLLGKNDVKECVDSICKGFSFENDNYIHDWNIIAEKVVAVKEILTAGAIKTIFMSSFNHARKISENLSALNKSVVGNVRNRKLFDMKIMRSQVSSNIRRSIELDALIDEINGQIEVRRWKSLKIPEKKRTDIEEFVARMKKYCKGVSAYEVVKRYGKKNLYAFISGTYPSLFEPQVFTCSYGRFIGFIRDIFENRTRQIRHVYSSFKASGLLTCLDDKRITEQQYDEMRKILRCHNVKLPEFATIAADFRFKVEPKGSPEFLTAGDASVCCMSMRTEKALGYALEKGFGILNAYYRGRVIANSLLWINDAYNCLVFDNIEVHPNYKMFNRYLREGFTECAEKIMLEHKLDFVVQGQRYNDLKLYHEDDEAYTFAEMRAREVSRPFYSDAENVRVVCSRLSETKLWKLFEQRDNKRQRRRKEESMTLRNVLFE